MKTVREVSRIAGVSVRTLHHYDAIGLLRPTAVSDAGYRLYDDDALRRLQLILLFRELQFPLKEIARILDRPDFDPDEALSQQVKLLTMQRDRLNAIISLAENIRIQGVSSMCFDAFDRSNIDQYADEARARWGETAAWQEYARRDPKQTRNAADGLMQIFVQLGALRTLSPDDAAVRAQIAALQQYITGNFYTCTDEILRGLGEMYTGDERMKRNIDKAGGEGTAEFARSAILAYLDR